NQPIKTLEAVQNPTVSYRYTYNQDSFNKIPGSPIAYWVSENIPLVFNENPKLYEYSTSASQNVTGNNNKYVRFHFELDNNKVGRDKKWLFYAKGGGYRKWVGNMLEVVNWTPEAREVYRTGHASQIIPEEYWYKKGITWGLITSALPSFRVLPTDSTFDKGGSSIFINDDSLFKYILGFLNTTVALNLMKCLNITLNFQVRDIRNLPIKIEKLYQVEGLVDKITLISEKEWDSTEISFGFSIQPLLTFSEDKIGASYSRWDEFAESQFNQLKENEEELNRIFIEIY